MNHSFLNPWLAFLPIAVLWCAISLGAAYASGWAALGRRYRYKQYFDGSRWRGQTVVMRMGVRYRNCVTLAANEAGFFMEMPLAFRLGCPSLMVPWSQIRVVVTGGKMQPGVQLYFTELPSVVLRLWGVVVTHLAWAVPEQVQLPEGF